MSLKVVVRVENAFKTYSSQDVLCNFNMHVPRGVIYGLLGASGCGKTTLLNCLVGRKKLDSGTLSVLGIDPGVSGVSRLFIGYMPQEIAIAPEFSIKESLQYFGRIYGISHSVINERLRAFSKLLHLPRDSKLIRKCSGGEQRRVSFAIALINNPKLLILDEPTVGLDPILREIIWNYLFYLVKDLQMTVIITTHYIEEVRQAHKVGFMRQGQLLAEDSPQKLLTYHSSDSLEKVFLKLSQKQSENNVQLIYTCEESINRIGIGVKTHAAIQANPKHCTINSCKLHISINRLDALFTKNFVQFYRNIGGTIFSLILPVISMLVLLMAIGDEIKDINIAVVNEEIAPFKCNDVETIKSNCSVERLSCRFLSELNGPALYKKVFETQDLAFKELAKGEVWAVLNIPKNFSHAFHARIQHGIYASVSDLNMSQMCAWLDVTNKQISTSIKLKLIEMILKLEKDILVECGYPITSLDIIDFNEFFYGGQSDKFTTFLIPGILLTVVFFMSITNTVDTIISDKLGGLWDRSTVAGVSSTEIILAHFVTQFLIVLIQVLELMILTFFVYKINYEGRFFEIMIILLAGGTCGMTYGFFISVICTNHSRANFLTTGCFYPVILISGVIWPLEGMSKVLQYCAFSFPIALPTISLRNIISKGWNFANFEVSTGFGIQILWIILLGVLCLCQLKTTR